MKDDFERCETCNEPMEYVCHSTDADGNRQEWGHYCPKCGY
jgi:hypothetical protein